VTANLTPQDAEFIDQIADDLDIPRFKLFWQITMDDPSRSVFSPIEDARLLGYRAAMDRYERPAQSHRCCTEPTRPEPWLHLRLGRLDIQISRRNTTK
jgi:hypothetical protein